MLRFIRKIKSRGQSGLVLPLAMVLLAAATFVILPGLWSMQTLLVTNRYTERDAKAYYAAEAGIADAFWCWYKGSTPPFTGSPPAYTLGSTINNMTVRVTKVAAASEDAFSTLYTIKSEGILDGQIQSTVYSEIVVNTGSSPFKYGIVALGGNISLSSSSQVRSVPSGHGDMFANGNISFGSSSSIDGVASYTGTLSGGCRAAKGCNQSQPQAFDAVDQSYYLDHANAGGIINHDVSNPSPSTLGPCHIQGNLTLSSSHTLTMTGVIWVDGYVSFGSSSSLIGTGDFQTNYLVANGPITFGSSCQLSNYPTLISWQNGVTFNSSSGGQIGTVYAPNGAVTLASSSTVNGSVVAKSVTLNSSSQVIYPVSLQTTPIPGISGGSSVTLTKFSSQ